MCKSIKIFGLICFDNHSIFSYCDVREEVIIRENIHINYIKYMSLFSDTPCTLRQTARDIRGYLTNKLQLWLHIKEPAWMYIFIGWLGNTFLSKINSDRKGVSYIVQPTWYVSIVNVSCRLSLSVTQIDARRHLDCSSKLLNTGINCTIYTWTHVGASHIQLQLEG